MRWLLFAALLGQPIAWPSQERTDRNADALAAGRRVSAQIACDICRLRLRSLLPEDLDSDELAEFVEDQLSESKEVCKMSLLADLLRDARLAVQTWPNGTAALISISDTPVYSDDVQSATSFHWKSWAVEQACLENFHRHGDKISETFRASFSSSDGDVEYSISKACQHSKPCQRQLAQEDLTLKRRLHEEATAAIARSRLAARSARDSAFLPQDSDFMEPKTVDYDIQLDYYRAVGVDEFETSEEIQRRCEKFKSMFMLQEELAKLHLGGRSKPASDVKDNVVKAACSILLHQATRRQYDHDRDMEVAAEKVGLRKRLPEKAVPDGRALLKQWDPSQEL